MKTKFYIIILCYIIQHSYGYANIPKKIVIISVPKCGTHLLGKCINLLGFEPSFKFTSAGTKEELQKHLNSKKNIMIHLSYKDEFKEILEQPDIVTFFIYRDPRDQLASWAYYMLKHNQALYINNNPPISTLTYDEVLNSLITEGEKIYYYKNSNIRANDLYAYYHLFLPWQKYLFVCSIKFEDIIGPHGGGSLPRQIQTLTKIASHLHIDLSPEKLEYVIENLFGESHTFRKGKIGGWEEDFKVYHLYNFNNRFKKLCTELGYD